MQVTTPGPKTVTISLQWQMQRTSTTMILQQAMDDRILKLPFSTFKQYLNFKHKLLANFSKTIFLNSVHTEALQGTKLGHVAQKGQ